MTRRKWIAAGVLGLWIGGLGMLAYREMYPNEERRRESLAMLIEPISYYYAIERNGELVGYSSSQIDTSVFGIQLRNTLVTAGSGGGGTAADSIRSTMQFSAQLTPRLKLSEMDVFSGRVPNRQVLLARSVGDALEIRTRTGSGSPADTIPFSRLAVSPEVAPLILALGQSLKPGDVRELEIFDRATKNVSMAQVRIEAESLFTIADSAAKDSLGGKYIALHSDTVRAWKANIPGAGGGLIWFDRNGRIVQQELGDGLTMVRTAFELAFENWRLARNMTEVPSDLPVPRPPSARPPPGRGG